MKKFHLIDIDHNRDVIMQNRLYEVASRITLKYGCMGRRLERCNFDHVREFWNYEEPYPSIKYFKTNVKVSGIKWFLYHKMNYHHEIWNADFLHGLLVHGKIFWNEHRFPSCEWYSNPILTDLIKSCPFGGKIIDPPILRHRWVGVPALYLKSSKDSISFMAGVMAGMKLIKHNNFHYAMVSKNSIPYIKKWGIPIEETWYFKIPLISPFWPSLFLKYMPEKARQQWLDVKKPYNADQYAAILWKIYVDSRFPAEGIPYLKSRRTIFYDLQCEEGAMEKLDKLRVEKNLTQLDNRIKEVVKELAKEKNEVFTN